MSTAATLPHGQPMLPAEFERAAAGARRRVFRVVDIFNTDRAAKSLGMHRAERVIQSQRYENVIVCHDGPFVATLLRRGIKVVTTPIPRRAAPLQMLRCARRMAKLFQSLQADIVHSHGSTASVCARWGARMAGVTGIVHTVHGFHFHQRMNALARKLYIRAERLLARHTDVLLFQNQEDLDESLRHRIVARMGNWKIGNGIDVRHFESGASAKHDPPVILMIGRFEPVKNQQMLLRAARRLADGGTRFEVWFAGGGPGLEFHRKMAADLGLAERTRFLDYVEDTAPIVRQASAAVLPSVKEGIPRGLLEPMAAGVPVVATDVKGNRETVRHNETGWLVPLDDDLALAHALSRILSDGSLARRLGEAGAQSVRHSFDEDRVVDRLLRTYDLLMSREHLG